jgi:hypothetical protein
MPKRINSLFLILMLLLFGCIKAYTPPIDGNAENKYVVSGLITDKEGWQEVEVSLSSPLQSPQYNPVSRCLVNVFDDRGGIFELEEHLPGKYQVWMNQADLLPGTSYRVTVVTPEGESLESGFDRMPKGPMLGSVYYALEDIPTTDPSVSNRVMQYFVDLDAAGDYSLFYKWEILETWEYHAALPAQYYYDGVTHEIIPPDSSNMVCWITTPVKNVFTLSAKGQSQNEYKKYRLHAIDGKTSRLGYLYSMLVRQLAVSEGAYNYWEQMRINSNEQGGLYEKQPLAVKGNLVNKTHPDKGVHGYFYAASASSRRFFYRDIQGIDLTFNNCCSPWSLGMFGWKEVLPWEYPVYFYYNEIGALRLLNLECIDCRILGGTTVKPDFWPN